MPNSAPQQRLSHEPCSKDNGERSKSGGTEIRRDQKKWFQVIQFAAALPAVMNGTELRKQDSGAVSLLAPRLRFSAPADQRSQLRLLVQILSGAGFS